MYPGYGGRMAAGARLAPSRIDPSLASGFCDKSASESTRKTYRIALNEFFLFTGNMHPAVIRPDDIINWRDHLQTLRKKPATVALKLSVIRSFFEKLRCEGMIAVNPAVGRGLRIRIEKSETPIRALSEREIEHLLAGPDTNTPDGARDYAIMMILLHHGIRVSEICSLRVSSIQGSYDNTLIKVKVSADLTASFLLMLK